MGFRGSLNAPALSQRNLAGHLPACRPSRNEGGAEDQNRAGKEEAQSASSLHAKENFRKRRFQAFSSGSAQDCQRHSEYSKPFREISRMYCGARGFACRRRGKKNCASIKNWPPMGLAAVLAIAATQGV